MKVWGSLGLLATLLASLFPATATADEVKELAVLKDPGKSRVSYLAFTADGTRLAAAGRVFEGSPTVRESVGQVIVWDVAKQQQLCVTEHVPQRVGLNAGNGFIPRAWISPDGKTVVTEESPVFRFWDGTTGKLRGVIAPKDLAANFTAAALSPDGALFAVAGADAFVKPAPGRVVNGFRVGDIALWDLKTGKVKALLPGSDVPGVGLDMARKSPSWVEALAFAPDGTRLAAMGGGEGDDRGKIKIWDLKTGKSTATLKPADKLGPRMVFAAVPLAWLADGKTLVLHQGTTLDRWDTTKGEHTDTFSLTGLPLPVLPAKPTPPVGFRPPAPAGDDKGGGMKESEHQSALSADGTRLAVQMIRVNLKAKPPTLESEVVVWDVAARRREKVLPLKVSAERLQDLARAADPNDGTGFVFRSPVVSLALSPDGKLLAVGDALDALTRGEPEGPVRVYEVAKLPAPAKAGPGAVAAPAPAAATAVRDAYERAVTKAREALLAGFDEEIKGPAKTASATGHLKDEKARFEKHGLVPWSEPMRSHAGAYLAAVADARTKVLAGVKGMELPADLRNLIDKQVFGRWKHQPGNGTITLYSSGRVNDPAGPHTWSFDNGVLTLRWKDPKAPGGFWVDRCNLAADGLSYSGANQNKTKISGTLVRGD
jgi:WD40 repeat protein